MAYLNKKFSQISVKLQAQFMYHFYKLLFFLTMNNCKHISHKFIRIKKVVKVTLVLYCR